MMLYNMGKTGRTCRSAGGRPNERNVRLPESRRRARDRARVSASVEHDQAVATKRLGHSGGEVRRRQAAAAGSHEQVRTRLRHDAGSHHHERHRVAMTLIRNTSRAGPYVVEVLWHVA